MAATILTGEQRSEIVQVLREALANTSRHARASAVQLSARVEPGRFILTVTDDGIGFDPTVGTTESHHGQRNMANRARMLDADLQVRSSLGQGTTIQLTVRLMV
jgi:signal transduction histidine kinase